jgi:hypothetical protein
MKVFSVQSIDQWEQIAAGSIIPFKVASGGRRVKLRFNTSAFVDVYASYSPDMLTPVLVASAAGLFEVQLHAPKAIYLSAVTNLDAEIFIQGSAHSHVVPSSDADSFTSLTPSGRRNSDMDKIMLLMRHNEKTRNAHLQAEIKAMRQETRRIEKEIRNASTLVENIGSTLVSSDDGPVPAKAVDAAPSGETSTPTSSGKT